MGPWLVPLSGRIRTTALDRIPLLDRYPGGLDTEFLASLFRHLDYHPSKKEGRIYRAVVEALSQES